MKEDMWDYDSPFTGHSESVKAEEKKPASDVKKEEEIKRKTAPKTEKTVKTDTKIPETENKLKRPKQPQRPLAPKSKDEKRREEKEKNRKKKRRKKIVACAVLFIVAAVAIFILCCVKLCNITSISVVNNTRYTEEQVITASSVDMGDNLILLDKERVETSLKEKLPYIGTVTIKKKLMDKVVITVKETKEKYSVGNGKKYILLDKDFKILNLESKSVNKTILIIGVGAVSPKEGRKLRPYNEDALDTALEILKHTDENKMKVQKIRTDNENDIRVLLKNGLRLDLGFKSEIGQKIKMAAEIIAKLKNEGAVNSGSVNLKSVNKAYYKEGTFGIKEPVTDPYIDENEETETTEATAESTTETTESTEKTAEGNTDNSESTETPSESVSESTADTGSQTDTSAESTTQNANG